MPKAYRSEKWESIAQTSRGRIAFRASWRRSAVLLGLVLGVMACERKSHDLKPTGETLYQLRTGDGPEEDRSRWDQIYSQKSYVYGTEPSPYLAKRVPLVPVGRALDLAMGEGRNAVFLAQKGFSVEGVDLSEVAIKKARRLAREHQVSLFTTVADLNHYQVRELSYSLIVMIEYFQRSLLEPIRAGLRPGGVFILEGDCEIARSPGVPLGSGRGTHPLHCDEVSIGFPGFQVVDREVQQVGAVWKARMTLKKSEN